MSVSLFGEVARVNRYSRCWWVKIWRVALPCLITVLRGSGFCMSTIFQIHQTMDKWTIKTPNSICRLFFKIDLLTEFVELCLTDFIDWRYIHSLGGIFNPACELLPPWTKELYLCTVVPLSSLWPPPLPKLNVQYIQTVCVWGGGGGWIVLL